MIKVSDPFANWRDQFLLAMSACGIPSSAYEDDDNMILRDYSICGWGPVEAMHNETLNIGDRRLLSDGPPIDAINDPTYFASAKAADHIQESMRRIMRTITLRQRERRHER